MASLPYALPVSPLPHSHMHAQSHSHSHSAHTLPPSRLGPGTQRSPSSKNLRQERSNGSLHVQAHSEPFHDHGHNHSHSDASIYSGAASNGFASEGSGLNGHSHSHSAVHSPYVNNEKVLTMATHTHHDHGHDHGHHDHCHGDHDHDHQHSHSHKAEEKRSAFTKFLVNSAEGSPTLHSILIEKDSRRIFYFMT